MTDIHYRHWRPGDDEGVMRILAPMGWCTPERYAAKFDDPGLRAEDVLIAERDGQIVGHLMLPHRRLRFGGATLPLGGIGMVVVDPAVRGAGVGRRLLDLAFAHHRAAGNALVGLFTQTNLVPAFEMYRRRGFVPVARRVSLHLPPAALQQRTDSLTARPATAADRAAITGLIDAWAEEHRCVSLDAATEPLADEQVISRADGTVVGSLEIVERPEGRAVRRLLVAPGVDVAAVLAAALGDETAETVAVRTNPGNRVHRDLAPLAVRTDEDETRLMLASLGLARVLAGLALETAARLRAAGAAPVDVALTVAETGERVRLDWSGAVLTVDTARTGGTPVTITTEHLLTGLAGQPSPPPSPALAPLWTALFPRCGVEMRLVNCW